MSTNEREARSAAATSGSRQPGKGRANRPVFSALQRQGKEHLIETVGKELRGMMSWIDEGGLDIDV